MGKDESRPYPRRPRLRDFDYQGTYSYMVTILTHGRRGLFNKPLYELVFPVLLDEATKQGFALYAYCFMPDHVHLLLGGKNDKANLRTFVSRFKQRSGYIFRKSTGQKLWYLSYYDHVVRKEESLTSLASYVLNNPVRKGLAGHFKEYPLCGSMVFSLEELSY